MKSLKRLGIDPLARLRDAVRQVPGRRPDARRPGVRRARRRGARDRAAARSSSSWATTRSRSSTTSTSRSRGRSTPSPASCSRSRPPIDALVVPEHRRGARRGGREARVLVGLPRAGRVVRGAAALLGLALARAGLLPRRAGAARPALARRGDRASPRRVGLAFAVALAVGARGRPSPRRSASCRSCSARRCSWRCSTPPRVGRGRVAVEALAARLRRRRCSRRCSTRPALALALPLFVGVARRERRRRRGPASLLASTRAAPRRPAELRAPGLGRRAARGAR